MHVLFSRVYNRQDTPAKKMPRQARKIPTVLNITMLHLLNLLD